MTLNKPFLLLSSLCQVFYHSNEKVTSTHGEKSRNFKGRFVVVMLIKDEKLVYCILLLILLFSCYTVDFFGLQFLIV
jgi:hypothetical protein